MGLYRSPLILFVPLVMPSPQRPSLLSRIPDNPIEPVLATVQRPHEYEHPQNTHPEGWSYNVAKNINGPKDWVFVSKFCAGDRQSPINLDTKTAVSNGTSGDLTFKKYDLINRENTNFENNGHTAELELITIPERAAIMSGGPLAQPYQLLQLHFHWGNTDVRGSEHTRDNKRFPLEMHLVHLASDIKWGVGSATSPANVPDGLAVAGFFWEISEDDNLDLQPIIERLKVVKKEKSETELLSENFNVATLISPVISGPYFSYHGSLTTPGCNEVVHWIIFKNTLKVSSSQMSQFRQLINVIGGPLMDNFRSIQPTNGRLVTISA